MHKHSLTHTKMVRSILRHIADETNQPFPAIKHRFVRDGDIKITTRFWDLLKTLYPNHPFTEVSCCPGCGKFELE